ncbi:MAG: replication-relaxation family protein [Chloroflexota bacterium]|nr:replication-relaxation family protein [Chloroflexota bacterium]
MVAQRVVTAGQLERLIPAVPARTLRYRTARLVRTGLLGRTRPYRARGSAPSYFWPSRAADAFVRGAPPAQGGPRNEPNPFFLAHAAAITELYVGLRTGGTPGLRLDWFVREGEARERFQVDGRWRAIAPDARIELRDDADQLLIAHVEIDRGTMSIPRLKAKAAGYAAYWFCAPWTKTYPFCPALLILTTTEARAQSVLDVVRAAAEHAGRRYLRDRPHVSVAACAMVDDQSRALADACWEHLTRHGALDLVGCLWAARAQLDRARTAAAAAQAARAERIATLGAEPSLMAEHLRTFGRIRVLQRLAGFGVAAGQALAILLDAGGPPSDIERDALAGIAGYLGTAALELDGEPGGTPTPDQQDRVDRLVGFYRARQLNLLDELIACHGPFPELVSTRAQLRRGALLEAIDEQGMPRRAEREAELQRAQAQRQSEYFNERDRAARAETGIVGRILGHTTRAEARLDAALLRRCDGCNETAFPHQDSRQLVPARTCPRCGSYSLRPPA